MAGVSRSAFVFVYSSSYGLRRLFTTISPVAKRLFVSVRRIMASSLASDLFHLAAVGLFLPSRPV